MADITISNLPIGVPSGNVVIPYSDGNNTYTARPSAIVAASKGSIIQVMSVYKDDISSSALDPMNVYNPELSIKLNSLSNKILLQHNTAYAMAANSGGAVNLGLELRLVRSTDLLQRLYYQVTSSQTAPFSNLNTLGILPAYSSTSYQTYDLDLVTPTTSFTAGYYYSFSGASLLVSLDGINWTLKSSNMTNSYTSITNATPFRYIRWWSAGGGWIFGLTNNNTNQLTYTKYLGQANNDIQGPLSLMYMDSGFTELTQTYNVLFNRYSGNQPSRLMQSTFVAMEIAA